MMEEKGLVPKRRFDGFEDKWLSNSFEELLGESDGIRRGPFGSALKKDLFVKKSKYVIYEQQNAIYDNYNYRYHITKDKYEELIKFALHGGDFIMSGAGTIGSISRVPKGIKPGVINQALIRIRINSEIIDPEYFLQWIRSDKMQKRLKESNPASAMENLIPMSELKKWDVSIPSYNEQQKIGEFFKVLDERIANQERKVDKVKALKSAYLTEMFPQEGETAPKTRFKGFEEEWKKTELGSIGGTFSGISGKTKKDFGHGTAEFVTYINVFNNTISDINITEKVVYDNKQTQVRYGDILFTTSSETPNEVGMSSVWLDDRPNVYLNSFCFGFRSAINIDYYFIGYMLRANLFRKQMEILAQGISRYNISKGKVLEIEVYLPTIQEQQKIGTFFKNLDNQITTEEKKLEKLKNMKEAYLKEMFV